MLPPPKSDVRLEKVLRAGLFAVTAELNPPDSADPHDVFDAALVLSQVCDAINATDASGAHCHMSSVAICALLTHAGYSPVMQVSCRDRNRIAIQGDVLGAAAMGVHSVLCLTGDDVSVGDQPGAKRVFDLDALHMLRTIRTMRDEGWFCFNTERSPKDWRCNMRVMRGSEPLSGLLVLNFISPPLRQREPLRFK